MNSYRRQPGTILYVPYGGIVLRKRIREDDLHREWIFPIRDEKRAKKYFERKRQERMALSVARVGSSLSADYVSGNSWATSAHTFTTGNLIAVSVHWQANNGSDDVTGVSDPTNGAYAAVDTFGEVTAGILVSLKTFYMKNITGGSLVITVNASGPAARATVKVDEISGADTTAPLDTHTITNPALVNPGLGSDDVKTANMTPSVAGCYLYGAVMNEAGTLTYTHGTGFTDGVLDSFTASEYQVLSGTTATPASFAATFGDIVTFIVAGMIFKPAGAGASNGGPLIAGGEILKGSLIRGGRLKS